VPELLEVESYRVLAESASGRTIARVRTPDRWILKNGTTPAQLRSVVGQRLVAPRRHGKLLLLDTAAGPTIGVRFGMTGVLEVDGAEGVEQLRYASGRRDPKWIRFELLFDGGGRLALRDARRLGAVELEPDESRLGPDATEITAAQLRSALDSVAPLKARLMDQRHVAGLGNLLTDELLWRSDLDPARPARSLLPAEQRRLHRELRRTLRQLATRGGSHTGDLQDAREPGARCPRDGAELERRTIGGRTTYSCPAHQR
jgi:formamidopyrimidine-DNA glycosylase